MYLSDWRVCGLGLWRWAWSEWIVIVDHLAVDLCVECLIDSSYCPLMRLGHWYLFESRDNMMSILLPVHSWIGRGNGYHFGVHNNYEHSARPETEQQKSCENVQLGHWLDLTPLIVNQVQSLNVMQLSIDSGPHLLFAFIFNEIIFVSFFSEGWSPSTSDVVCNCYLSAECGAFIWDICGGAMQLMEMCVDCIDELAAKHTICGRSLWGWLIASCVNCSLMRVRHWRLFGSGGESWSTHLDRILGVV